MCGLPRTAIYDTEIGRRKLTLDEMACLCRAFGIDLAELVTRTDSDICAHLSTHAVEVTLDATPLPVYTLTHDATA